MQDKLNDTSVFSDNSDPLERPAKRGAIYVHVPFCARKCAYCKFYKQFPSTSEIDSYIDCISSEISNFFDNHKNFEIQSIFFGGGTPTCLSIRHLEKLCQNFKNLPANIEWTVEAAPGTINRDKLNALRDCGVNRLSIGIQSFDENTLRDLGRPHPLKTALNALDCALEIFENLNIDLIFGSRNQTMQLWQGDLEKALSYPIKHLSAYCLEFESASSCCAGNLKEIDTQIREVDFLYKAMEVLENSGFKNYEISNYAKPGFECAHNLNTWNMNSWVGFGPAAASQIDSLRRRNPADLNLWENLVKTNSKDYDDIVKLDQAEMLSCSLIFGLRKICGVNLKALKMRYPKADLNKYYPAISELLKEGLCEIDGDYFRLTKTGIPLADSVAEYFL